MGSARASKVVAAVILALLTSGPAAGASVKFRPRIGAAMGLFPLRAQRAPALATVIPLVYHGGAVMRGVTLHTIFWAPSGYRFSGPPSPSVPSYTSLVQQFASDVAGASGRSDNVFSLLNQYPDRTGLTRYAISYDPARDSILDTNPYPAKGRTCNSPSGAVTCVSDSALQAELLRVIHSHDPTAVGLHDLWLVMLPPDVDTCVSPESCATTAYAGYHSQVAAGPSPVVYAAIPDPLLEMNPPAGSDPQGNPEAEAALDVIGHEVAEAISDPTGTGWMDPNGFEIGDKCETGPQRGTPLGYGASGAPYNQLIGGHGYFIQSMWSNLDSGCRQSSSASAPPPNLPHVALSQYSSEVSGSNPAAASTSVLVGLLRGGAPVAAASGHTDGLGRWRVSLRTLGGKPAAVGDDRDELIVRYGRGARAELIQTGNGGNPFTASGWTGWFDLNHGYAVGSRSVLIAPCSQVGELTLRVNGASTGSPELACATGNDSARIQVAGLGPGTNLSLSSEDNRAPTASTPSGALVNLTVTLGEPGAVDPAMNPLIPFTSTGRAACTADLHAQRVSCTGLVPRGRYTLIRQRGSRQVIATADGSGTASFSSFARQRQERGSAAALSGGDLLTLRNSAARTLTALHVAHLRVDLTGASSAVRSGRCEPDGYLGAPISAPPTGHGVGQPGVAGLGLVCPHDGSAAGLSSDSLIALDDRSAGRTVTEVPLIEGTAPLQNATLYGPFRALAQAGFPTSDGTVRPVADQISVRIVRAGSHRVVFRARNVNTPAGVRVRRLPRGSYTATWLLRDAAGDTRTLRTQFVEA